MEIFGMSVFDLGVLAVVVLAALIGLLTGFIRGGLFMASWILSLVLTLLTFERVVPYAATYVDADWQATLAAIGVTFVAYLIAFLVVSHFVGKVARRSRLNLLDRSLGLLAGGVVAVIVLAIIYMPVAINFPIEDYPMLRDAKTRPIIERTSMIILDLVPDDLRPDLGDSTASQAGGRATLERLTAPPPVGSTDAAEAADDEGYAPDTLDRLDDEIAGQR